eukprot:scaffold19.g1762.t1
MLASAIAPAAPAPSRPLGRTLQQRRSARGRPAAARFKREWWPSGWEVEEDAEDELLITVFGADGTLTTIPALPRRAGAAPPPRRGRRAPLPLPAEQGLCIGSIFAIAATNGVDATRRLNLLGFCQSIEELQERVEDAVLARGGEVFEAEAQLKPGGFHRALRMTVALPLLWGVPPEARRLERGIAKGGGVIERAFLEWHFH